MFRKILVANRGEIALRIICACKDLGIRSVAIYSEADVHSPHVRLADEAVCIGPPHIHASYMNIPAVISAASITNADAIHPGYGFLSEDSNFAEICETSGITFIGPSPEIIRLMGNKSKARRELKALGLSVIPGSDGLVTSADEAAEWAATIGYPVVLKAAAGGGGRGMRVANEPPELPTAFRSAQSEAVQVFGSDDLYLEKLIQNARHVEIQVLIDHNGNALHLGERDCSLQWRHRKILEESPAPSMTPEKRQQIGKLVEGVLSRAGYTNAGTVEFLMDETGELYFMEINTRIQVEHPVTEMVTGIDLAKSQILLAAGVPLSAIAEGEAVLYGHSIECRINAENPETFIPSSGRICSVHLPGGTGVRVDTACHTGSVIHPYYDSLIAKLIVHGRNREEALSRMRRALQMFVIEGVHTLLPLHKRILCDPDFIQGNYGLHFLERFNPLPAQGRRNRNSQREEVSSRR
jgi:acetyl-CoA carboxylase biotin carboxylase subunit